MQDQYKQVMECQTKSRLQHIENIYSIAYKVKCSLLIKFMHLQSSEKVPEKVQEREAVLYSH